MNQTTSLEDPIEQALGVDRDPVEATDYHGSGQIDIFGPLPSLLETDHLRSLYTRLCELIDFTHINTLRTEEGVINNRQPQMVLDRIVRPEKLVNNYKLNNRLY